MYLGMDGGGTKTDYILMDYTGKLASHVRTDTTHYMQIGMNQAVSLIRRSIEEACRLAGVGIEDIRCAFLGVPGFSESASNAAQIEERHGAFLRTSIKSSNHEEAGWAGSLAGRPWSYLVCGTGAIGYGINRTGLGARSSGWGYFCGDDGSAVWLGKKAIEPFPKQAVLRMEKTSIYVIMR